MKTLGEIGYEKWRSLLEPYVTAGLPPWRGLTGGTKAAWEDVAQAIAEEAITRTLVFKADSESAP